MEWSGTQNCCEEEHQLKSNAMQCNVSSPLTERVSVQMSHDDFVCLCQSSQRSD